MYSYNVYNLCIHSDLAFPGLPRGGDTPDVTIHIRPLDDDELATEDSRGGRVWGRIYHDLQFLVEGGKQIVVDNRSGISEDMVRGYIMGVLMATLLRQRGYLVLHACSVAKEGQAIGFVGESGWGKSTLAEYFCQHGYDLINDDVMTIQTDPPPPVVLPGPPQVRLRPEAGQWLRQDFEDLPRIYARAGKRVSFRELSGVESVNLSKLYILDEEYAMANKLEALAPREATIALIRHTRVTNLIKDALHTAQHLEQCVNLLKHTSIARLHRVRSLERLPEIMDLVEKDLRYTTV